MGKENTLSFCFIKVIVKRELELIKAKQIYICGQRKGVVI